MHYAASPPNVKPKFSFVNLTYIASLKFPAGTVAGHFKQAVATNANYDIVRFDNQRLNWTLKEFDVLTLSLPNPSSFPFIEI